MSDAARGEGRGRAGAGHILGSIVGMVVTGFLPALLLVGIMAFAKRRGEFGFPEGDAGLFFNIALLGSPVFLILWSIFLVSRFVASPVVVFLLSLPAAAVMCVANAFASLAGCSVLSR